MKRRCENACDGMPLGSRRANRHLPSRRARACGAFADERSVAAGDEGAASGREPATLSGQFLADVPSHNMPICVLWLLL